MASNVHSGGSWWLREERPGQVDVRVRPDDAAALSAALGLPVPGPNAVTVDGDRAVLWLGPDEWLVLGGPDEAEVRARLGGCPASVVEVSAQRAMLVLGGPAAAALLAFGCALDLDRDLVVGRCAQTMLARAQVIIWRAVPEEFRLLVRISFARYVRAWISDAATGLAGDDDPEYNDGPEYGHEAMDPTPIGEHDGLDRNSGPASGGR